MDNNFETSDSVDFEFKPINQGLGFHQKETPVTKPLSKDFEDAKKADLQKQYKADLLKRSVTLEETNQMKQRKPITVKAEQTLATPLSRSLAFAIDLLFVISNVLLTVYVLVNMTKIDISDLMGIDLLLLCSGLTVFYYLLYFSVFELMPWSTFGKYFFDLKVTCNNGSRLSFNESLLRSLLSIGSLPLLVFDWHNKLTKTKVLKNESH